MNFDELKNPELQEKLKSAQSPEDILAIAKEEGFELTDDQLEAVSGGASWRHAGWRCPNFSHEGA